MFESDQRNRWSTGDGPAVLVRLTAPLQERIASLVRMVRDHKLHHVVMPLTSADHSWSARYIHTPDSRMYLDSTLCVSATDIWVETMRRAWRERRPPERVSTARLALREIMPIDYMPVRELPLPSSMTRAVVAPLPRPASGTHRGRAGVRDAIQRGTRNGAERAQRDTRSCRQRSGSAPNVHSVRRVMRGRASTKSSIDGRLSSRPSAPPWRCRS